MKILRNKKRSEDGYGYIPLCYRFFRRRLHRILWHWKRSWLVLVILKYKLLVRTTQTKNFQPYYVLVRNFYTWISLFRIPNFFSWISLFRI